jgi:hypothetical protein
VRRMSIGQVVHGQLVVLLADRDGLVIELDA